ncbi:hypothetical protein APHAL10511_002804 [Amanita phalloides]|nr:hypothetical protein APHAL10511_002804 [Amanita phalloides]
MLLLTEPQEWMFTKRHEETGLTDVGAPRSNFLSGAAMTSTSQRSKITAYGEPTYPKRQTQSASGSTNFSCAFNTARSTRGRFVNTPPLPGPSSTRTTRSPPLPLAQMERRPSSASRFPPTDAWRDNSNEDGSRSTLSSLRRASSHPLSQRSYATAAKPNLKRHSMAGVSCDLWHPGTQAGMEERWVYKGDWT